MTLYAAYASNLHPEQMLRIAPHSPLRATGWLQGWRLTFGGEERGWDGALATVVEDPAAQVYVALYDVTPEDESALDDTEGVGIGAYRKIRVRAATLDGEAVAWAYVLDDYEGGVGVCTRRLRGRPAQRALPRHAGGRRRGRRCPDRVRHRPAHATVPLGRLSAGPRR